MPQWDPDSEEKLAEEKLIDELSELAGIIPEYYGLGGERHTASRKAKAAVLRAMGLEISAQSLDALKNKQWRRLVEPVVVLSEAANPKIIPLYIRIEEDTSAAVSWTLKGEDGSIRAGEALFTEFSAQSYLRGARHARVELLLPADIALGYHELNIHCALAEGRTRLIITPDECYCPPVRTWGLSVNLYSVGKGESGVGDFSDLSALLEGVGLLGGGFVGINPLHSIPNERPWGISPYSPISRLYKNFIYLPAGEDGAVSREASTSQRAANMDVDAGASGGVCFPSETGLVDYEKAASVKGIALKARFKKFYKEDYKTNTSMRFTEFIASEGKALEDYATFMALAERYGAYDFRMWPPEFRSPDSPSVADFREKHKGEVLYQSYIQWIIDGELADASRRGIEAGMKIGLYQDIAVGSVQGGSEAWSTPEVFAGGVSAGAPPDDFNPQGQGWGVAVYNPAALREAGYESFIQTIRKNMRHSGALRIDHALGLFRMFWVPDGMPPRDGVYVRYPFEDLLRIIALESVREKTIVIAEDLGIVTDEARFWLKKFKMLSYRLFYFERQWPNREFLPPASYPETALAAVTTHDLPTLPGYWAGRDIELKNALSIYPSEELKEQDEQNRRVDKSLLIAAIRPYLTDGFPPDAESMTLEMCLAVYKYLASTPSMLVAVSLDDILGVLDQQNMPGTVAECPNWSRRCPLDVDGILKSKALLSLSEIFRELSR